jgi:hypothetical protein
MNAAGWCARARPGFPTGIRQKHEFLRGLAVKIEILSLAEQDLLDGFRFYESQTAGVGSYFLDNIFLDIESLQRYAGIHLKPHKHFHRLLSKKFPFAIYYTLDHDTVFIQAVVDCRRDADWIKRRLA